MRIIFTKNGSLLSKVIRWAFGEPVSHCAIVFDNMLVTHSNLLGVGLDWYPSFSSKSSILYQLEYDVGLEKEEEVYQSMLNAYCGKSYDFGAFLYFSWRAFLLKFFNKPLPRSYQYDDEDEFLCTEWVLQLPEWILKNKNDLLGRLITPYGLYKALERA